jgi:threonyl-tRNA synthetase
MRIPYLLVVGEREAAAGTASVRCRRDGELGEMTADQMIERMQREVAEKTN